MSEGNISLHFQTFILPLIVIIQWYFCLTAASAPHRDLIWSSSVCLEWHEETEQTETDSIQKNCGNVSKLHTTAKDRNNLKPFFVSEKTGGLGLLHSSVIYVIFSLCICTLCTAVSVDPNTLNDPLHMYDTCIFCFVLLCFSFLFLSACLIS